MIVIEQHIEQLEQKLLHLSRQIDLRHVCIGRIEDGSFGLCDSCEKPIARERLEAIPYARLCMPCKIQEEE
jgi:DnaK suppressor protein